MGNSRNDIGLVFLIQLFLIALKASGNISFSWTVILIPAEALVALPLLAVALYMLGIVARIFICIFRSISKPLQTSLTTKGK